MPELLRMPEVAASSTEAVLSRWPLAENQPFSAKDVIATVETEKALVDVEAETDGVILRRLVDEGAEVAVGAAIAVLGQPGEDVGDLDALLASLGVADAPAAPAPAQAPAAPREPAAAPTPAPPAAPAPEGARRFASPLARRLANEAGLQLADLVGTGPGGRIVRRDVDKAIAERVRLEEPDTRAGTPAAALAGPPAQGATGYTDQPLSRMRKAVAARLTESKATAPHFYVRGTARVDRLLALREELNSGGGVRVSVNDLVVKAVAQAHVLVPAMNVVWTGDAIRSFDAVDVAVAVATDRGLLTPVVRGVDRLPISAVAAATRDLATRAQEGRLQQSELEGGAVSVSNLGMYGTEEFSAILNPPQSSILAVGAASQQPVVTDGRLDVAQVLKVTLSVDHRPVDGATAAQWMRTFLALLEAPVRILA